MQFAAKDEMAKSEETVELSNIVMYDVYVEDQWKGSACAIQTEVQNGEERKNSGAK